VLCSSLVQDRYRCLHRLRDPSAPAALAMQNPECAPHRHPAARGAACLLTTSRARCAVKVLTTLTAPPDERGAATIPQVRQERPRHECASAPADRACCFAQFVFDFDTVNTMLGDDRGFALELLVRRTCHHIRSRSARHCVPLFVRLPLKGCSRARARVPVRVTKGLAPPPPPPGRENVGWP
jgi:hypothetical protein